MSDPITNHYLIAALVATLSIAFLSDIRRRRIPNLLVVSGLCLGLAGHTWLTGVSGLLFAASGALAGLLCLLPFYSFGALAAGDVKLMAMCGAFLGPLYVVIAAVASLVAGGLVGVAWAFWQLSADDEKCAEGTASPAAIDPAGNHASGSQYVPYALAIGGGVLIAVKVAPTYLIGL